MSFAQNFLFNLNRFNTMGSKLIFWVRPRWTVRDIGDQTGKIILITGANSGTGFISAQALYQAGAKVYLACRSADKAQQAIASIQAQTQGKARGEMIFLQMDLTDLKSVQKAAEEIRRKEQRLDVLLCNAGIMATREGQYTAQDYTLQFGTNVLGHQALIHHLLPVLLYTSRADPSNPPRVVILSSMAHSGAPVGGVDYKSIVRGDSHNSGKGAHELDKFQEYAQSKWGNIAQAKYLDSVYGPSSTNHSRRVAEGQLLCYSVHPGLIKTGLLDHMKADSQFLTNLVSILGHTPSIGATNQLWITTTPAAKAKAIAGCYIVPFQRIGRVRPDLLDEAKVTRMWDWCEEQVAKHA